ncbi:MAG: CpaE family protein [Caulobacterales bacterium]
MTLANFNDRHVLVIGENLAPVAQEALGQARFEIAGADHLEFLGSLHAAMELILIDAEAVDPTALVGVLTALAARPAAPAVLLTGAHLPASLARALMKLQRSDVLEAPFTATDLARAASALMTEAPVSVAPHNAHCWTVVGSVGGCGATTIAVELASTLAHRSGADRRVALVDLNLADGATAAYLGATANMLLAEVSSTPERIDAAVLDAFAMRVGDGLDLLACPRDPKAFSKIGQAAICRVLEVACQVYDWIVIDMPRHHQDWTLDVLAGSDEILVVSELTVPALLAARALASEIEGEIPTGASPRIILNRLASRVFGPAPSLAEAEKALQRKADGGVTSDWEAAAASVNLGGSISHHRPRSKIVRDIGVLVDRLTQTTAVQQARRA